MNRVSALKQAKLRVRKPKTTEASKHRAIITSPSIDTVTYLKSGNYNWRTSQEYSNGYEAPYSDIFFDPTPNPWDVLEVIQERDLVRQKLVSFLETLKPMQAVVFIHRFGLIGPSMAFTDLAKCLKLKGTGAVGLHYRKAIKAFKIFYGLPADHPIKIHNPTRKELTRRNDNRLKALRNAR